MDDGRSGKQNQRKVAEELKGLIKAVKDTYTRPNARPPSTQDADAEMELRIDRTRQADALEKMGDVFENATEDFYRMHPDPFDERAPHSIFPGCKLGLLQKELSSDPDFLDKVVEDFILETPNTRVRAAACRLLLLTLPGFEVQPTFNSFGQRLVPKLEHWSRLELSEPLCSLAIGLLGLAMECPDIAGEHKAINYALVPRIIIQMQILIRLILPDNEIESASPPAKKSRLSIPAPSQEDNCDSRSSFTSEVDIRPNHRMHPMTDKRRLTLLLEYLIPMAEYFEHLPKFIETNVLSNVLLLIKSGDSIIKLETLKLLSSLLCHSKVAVDFVESDGLDVLIQVPKGSRAAAAVSVCLYYLAYNNDVMERLARSPAEKLKRVVEYTLDLIETKHDSARVHGIMFFSYALQNKSLDILKYFDECDGVRRLYNVLSTLKILQKDQNHQIDTHAEKTCTKMASICILRYLEQHLSQLAAQNNIQLGLSQSGLKNCSLFEMAREIDERKVDNLDKFVPFVRLIELEAPRTLVRLALHASDWVGFAGKLETVKSLLQIVAVLSYSNKALLQLTMPIITESTHDDLQVLDSNSDDLRDADDPRNTSLSLLIKMAEQCDEHDPIQQQSVEKNLAIFILQKACCCSRTKNRDKIMRAVQDHHGVYSLVRFLEQPGLRVYAASALAGLCRLDNVKQTLSKLLKPERLLGQALVEHVDRNEFRNALEKLLSCTGNPVFRKILWDPDGPRKAQVVENTQIKFNKKELLQLIHSHLREEGFHTAAEALRSEANIRPIKLSLKSNFKSPNQGPRPRKGTFESLESQKPNTKRYQNARPKIQFSRSSHSTKSPAIPKKLGIKPVNNDKTTDVEVKTDQNVSLSKLVEFWLRDQHHQCRNPILTVPEFSIFQRHKCPEPKNPKPKSAPISTPLRLRGRAHHPKWGGLGGKALDKKLIWSRFKSTSSNVRTTHLDFGTTARLCPKENMLVLGCHNGDVLMYNAQTDRHVQAYNCTNSPIINLDMRGDLLLTTQLRGNTRCTLWNFPDIDMRVDFNDPIVTWAGFANNSERIALTRLSESVLYDTAAERNLLILPYKDKGCGYTCNRAVFSPQDDQILSDGILWDLRSGKHIHRFNKLNSKISGTFNPYAPEVIINSEVWDLRTNRLLKIVPQLAGTFPRFSPLGSIVMACPVLADVDLTDLSNNRTQVFDEHLGSSINILDSRSYNLLHEWKFESSKTKVPRRKIYDFCIKKDEEKINVLEAEWTTPDNRRTSDVIAKWYSVGILPDGEDSDQDDENPSDDEDEDDARSYGFDPTQSDESGSGYFTPYDPRDIPFDRPAQMDQSDVSVTDTESNHSSPGIQESMLSTIDEVDQEEASSIHQDIEDSNDGFLDEQGQPIADQPDEAQWEDLDDF